MPLSSELGRAWLLQLWRTASVKGEERALHHRAGVQSNKAIAARQCDLPPRVESAH